MLAARLSNPSATGGTSVPTTTTPPGFPSTYPSFIPNAMMASTMLQMASRAQSNAPAVTAGIDLASLPSAIGATNNNVPADSTSAAAFLAAQQSAVEDALAKAAISRQQAVVSPSSSSDKDITPDICEIDPTDK